MSNYILDLDNTLTDSRSEIHASMFDTVTHLREKVIISGASESQMKKQLCNLKCPLLSQNGNVCKYWKRLLTPEEEATIMGHIALYANPFQYDRTEKRGAQISYSFVGHSVNLYTKNLFDPDRSKRATLLAKHPAPEGIEMRVAGTTCFDYFPKGLNKGYNVAKYMKLKGWRPRETIYIGDAICPGGNDESVIGVLPYFQVANWQETLTFLQA